MFDLYTFDPKIAKDLAPCILKEYGIHYSALFDCMLSFRGTLESIEVIAPYIRRRFMFGDLFGYTLPEDLPKLLNAPASPGELLVDYRSKDGFFAVLDR